MSESEMDTGEDDSVRGRRLRVVPENIHLRGYVLVGGRSRRMGVDKAVINVDGRSALEHRIDLVGEFCGRDIAIVGAGADETEKNRTPPLVATLVDRGGRQGPLDGVITALEHAATTPAVSSETSPETSPEITTGLRQAGPASTLLAMVLAVDLWNISRKEIERMLAVFSDPEVGPTTDVVHLCSPDGSGDQPLCALWRVAESLDVLRPAFARGERSVVKAWLELRRTAIVVSESVLANINTPNDVEQWKLHRAASEVRGNCE